MAHLLGSRNRRQLPVAILTPLRFQHSDSWELFGRRFAAAAFALDSDPWFQHPGAMAFRALGRLGQFLLGKLEATRATSSRFHNGLVFGVLETTEEMIKVVRNPCGRLLHQSGNLAN